MTLKLVYDVSYDFSDFEINKIQCLISLKQRVVNLFALLKAKHAVHIQADAIASLPPLFFKPNSIGMKKRSLFSLECKI